MSEQSVDWNCHWRSECQGLDGLEKAASELAAALPRRGVVALQGEMGAGKTTLVAALCRCWGIREGVSSPTFFGSSIGNQPGLVIPNRLFGGSRSFCLVT